MENKILYLENIKCGGCASFIEGKLRKDFQIEDAKVDYEKGTVQFSLPHNQTMETIVSTLSKMGYPQSGEGNGLQKAKSYVSCMIGRVSKN